MVPESQTRSRVPSVATPRGAFIVLSVVLFRWSLLSLKLAWPRTTFAAWPSPAIAWFQISTRWLPRSATATRLPAAAATASGIFSVEALGWFGRGWPRPGHRCLPQDPACRGFVPVGRLVHSSTR